MMSSPRKSLIAALLAALPRGLDDGAVAVVHAGELVTVTLTLPGAGRPLVTATVRRPAPASDAERQLQIPAAAVPARRPSVPPPAEAPATTTATATPAPVPLGPMLPNTVRVWIPIGPWRALEEGTREYLGHFELEDGDGHVAGMFRIAWQERATPSPGYAVAEVPVGAGLDELRVLCREEKLPLYEGELYPTLPASIEVPPIAPPGRVLRRGDAVFIPNPTEPGRSDLWLVRAIEGEYVELGRDGSVRTSSVTRAQITLGAADLWECEPWHATSPLAGPTSPLAVAEERALAAAAAAPTEARAPTEIFSVEIDGADVDGTDEDSARWAERHGLRWVCGGCLSWHVEGGCSDVTRLRMVSAVPSAHAAELLDLCESEGLEARVTPHKGTDHTLLHAGSFVFEDSASDVLAGWAVTETPKRGELIRLARGATESSVDLARLRRFTNGSGAWRIVAPRAAKPSKVAAKTPAKKAPAESPAKASTKPSKPGVSWAATREPTAEARRHGYPGACLVVKEADRDTPHLARRHPGQTDANWIDTVRIQLKSAQNLTWARLYSKAGVCLWDSRDGGEPSTGPAPKTPAKAATKPAEKVDAAPAEAPASMPLELPPPAGECEVFAPRGAVPWKQHAKKGRYCVLRHWVDGRVELLNTAPTEDAARKLWNDSHYSEPGIDEVVTVRPDGGHIGSSSRGHSAYAVPGQWVVVVPSERGWLRWRFEAEEHARERFELASTGAVADATGPAALYGPDLKEVSGPRTEALARMGAQSATQTAPQPTPDAPRRHGERRTPPRDDAANARALRGRHCIVGRTDEGWELAATRDAGETHPAWHGRAKALLSKYARVRVYDAKPRCTWDSADAQGQSGGAS